MKRIFYFVSILLITGMISDPQDVHAQIFKSKQTKRHKKLLDGNNYKTGSRVAPIEILVSVQPPAESSPKPAKTFLDLTPDVQKELLKRLEHLEDTGSSFMELLKRNFSNKAAASEYPEILDLSEMKRQIIVGVFNKSLFPGDRVYRIDVLIKTNSSEVYFTSCDAVITKYETLEIAKQSQTTNIGFEAGANAGNTIVTNTGETSGNTNGTESNSQTGADDKNGSSQKATNSSTTGSTKGRQSTTGLGATAKFNASRSRTEEGVLRQRYVALSGNILEKGVKLYTESISGIDLTGNIIAEVSFKFTSVTSDFFYSFDKLYKKNGDVQSPDSIEIKSKIVIYPALSHDVKMNSISANGVLRAVVSKENTIMEGDDHAAMLEYKDIKPDDTDIVLARKSDLVPKKWVIKTDKDRLRIRASTANGAESGVANFENTLQASAFLQWLRDGKPGIVSGKGILQKGKFTLFVENDTLENFIKNCKIVLE